MDNNKIQVPIPSVKRFPSYLRILRQRQAEGMEYISATVLADELNLKPIQVRKDISCTGIEGKPNVGFVVDELIDSITHALGWDNATDAILVGTGSLGQALLGYRGFAEHNLSISVAFDADPEKIQKEIHGVMVRSMKDLPALVKRLQIRLGILTVPRAAAQTCASAMVEAGITGIWNFTTEQLEVPEDVIIQNVDLAESLAVLSHAITRA